MTAAGTASAYLRFPERRFDAIYMERQTLPLENLNHFLVAADDLEATRRFYVDVLGLEEGFRPPFDFLGHWIYLGDRAVVHLADQRDYLDKVDHIRDGSGDSATGAIDHIAFEATGLQDMVETLERHGVPARHRKIPDFSLHQIFVHDPNGVLIELNYPADEGVGMGLSG